MIINLTHATQQMTQDDIEFKIYENLKETATQESPHTDQSIKASMGTSQALSDSGPQTSVQM